MIAWAQVRNNLGRRREAVETVPDFSHASKHVSGSSRFLWLLANQYTKLSPRADPGGQFWRTCFIIAPMEGNACYKFSTIRRYIAQTGASPVRLAIDVGANIGDMTRLLKSYFPSAYVYAFEAVGEYFEIARARTANIKRVRVFHRAVTAQHLYRDDLGRESRQNEEPLRIFKATQGAGWRGGSRVIAADKAEDFAGRRGYQSYPGGVRACTLDQLIGLALRRHRAEEIDVLKMDCEGCEH